MKNRGMFSRHSSLFSRAQEQRNLLFLAQSHQLSQKIAALDMQAQLAFKNQQLSLEQNLSALFFSHTTQFGAFIEEIDDAFHKAETERRSKSSLGQTSRRSIFDNAQRTRQWSFEMRSLRVQQNAIEKEAERSREFLVWKEQKMWEMEKNVARWRAQFSTDEAMREREVDELKLRFP